jgi:predicted transcriptional regulator
MKKDRKELEESLIEVLTASKLKTQKKVVADIKKHLLKNYEIVEAQSWIDDPESELPKLDIRQLLLLTEQVYAKTGKLSISVEDCFTENVINEARQFSGSVESRENEIDFPITIRNASIVGHNAYMVTLDIKTIDKLLDNQLLFYDFNLQREAKHVRRKDKIVIEPNLNMNNVKEITQHLLEQTLVPTTLVFNAQTRSAIGGTELIFDSNKMELTITKGTRLAIVDGYHRCRASQNALQLNSDIEFNFAVLLTNYSTKRAQQYQSQLAKATPISRTRIQELEASRLSDTVVQRLKSESDLQGKVSQTNRVHSNEFVSYNVLADNIDEQFKMENRADAEDVADFLIDYFNFLVSSNDFIKNLEESKKKLNLIGENSMFVGYITLGRRLFESNIPAREVRKIIKNIDFSRSNQEWKELGILDEKENIADTNKSRKAIKDYFEKLELGTMV